MCALFQYNDDSVITIQRNGTSQASSLASIQNNHLYSGSANDLILSQVYTTSFTCEYDMRAYPFDSQRCSMIFIMEVRLHIFEQWTCLWDTLPHSGQQWKLCKAGQGWSELLGAGGPHAVLCQELHHGGRRRRPEAPCSRKRGTEGGVCLQQTAAQSGLDRVHANLHHLPDLLHDKLL